ncbi:MAG: hypothetical protein ACXVLZ_15080, partial [Acidimicrobiia bacterium]
MKASRPSWLRVDRDVRLRDRFHDNHQFIAIAVAILVCGIASTLRYNLAVAAGCFVAADAVVSAWLLMTNDAPPSI